ncbi:MAG: tetratricopeptide repeat protein [Candidatus Omnitrophica bacterium]|nr:tetratricopeptide repeat protein [Candidatus Omnitrophota bacterium]
MAFLLGAVFLAGCTKAPDAKAVDGGSQGQSSGVAVSQGKPVEPKVMGWMAEAEDLKAKGRFAESVSVYEKVIKERPDLAEPYFRLGVLFFNLGLSSKSEEYYLKAIEKDFRNPEIYFHLGYIKESEGKSQEALEWYLKAEEKGVGSAELYFNIGNVFVRLGNQDRAVDYYKKAISVNPGHVDAFINLSIISFQKAQFADASFYLDKARELGYVPPPDYLNALASKAMGK